MKSVILISDPPLNLATLEKVYQGIAQANRQSSERLVLQGPFGWFAFEIDQALAKDFDDEGLMKVRSLIDNPSFTQLLYSSAEAADLAVSLLPSIGTILIDNDHGLIAELEEIKRRIREGSEWQTLPQ
jgi:hypothetical protein